MYATVDYNDVLRIKAHDHMYSVLRTKLKLPTTHPLCFSHPGSVLPQHTVTLTKLSAVKPNTTLTWHFFVVRDVAPKHDDINCDVMSNVCVFAYITTFNATSSEIRQPIGRASLRSSV